MSNSLTLDKVLENIKNIVDNIQCPICDKAEGSRWRYSCGHTICDECMTIAEGCVLCLTPPIKQQHNIPKLDTPASERTKHACDLLKACQEAFQTNVYRRLRVSEQLKIEKEIFPECIQAPVKYYNKRKSSVLMNDKENIFDPILPGEIISPPQEAKMKNTNNIVNQWLNKNYSRRALSDLNVNQQNNSRNNSLSLRKRLHSFSPNRKQASKILKTNERSGILNVIDINTLLHTKEQNKCEHEESGIFIDDEPIYIEDSQSQIIDKDKLAILAVEAAEKDMINTFSCDNSLEITLPKNDSKKNLSVPHGGHKQQEVIRNIFFYKKGLLFESCPDCTYAVNEKETAANEPQNISISVENKSFSTTITISNCNPTNENKSSVLVQTDISDILACCCQNEKNNITNIQETCVSKNTKPFSEDVVCFQSKSQDLFTDDIKIESNTNFDLYETNKPLVDLRNTIQQISPMCVEPAPKSNIIIDDSDSDTLSEEPTILHVSADVHRSCDSFDYEALGEICYENIGSKTRRRARGITPDSNNSSEKENCDPNRMKKRKLNKKKKHIKV